MLRLRSRIAPTPSGFLHLGNAFNFLLTEFLVRREGGSLRLRIDDMDAPRVREAYLQDLFETLNWLQISPDEGPRDVAMQLSVYSQSLRLENYQTALQQLVETGLVFACTCSRKEVVEATHDGQYPGTCLHRNIPLDTPDAAWRIRTPEDSVVQFHDGLLGAQSISIWKEQRHFIVRRRDGLPSYHLASLCDDVQYEINTIVRGEDLLSSTGAQLYLADILGWKSFLSAQFLHHPLLKDEQGNKLSKGAGSLSLQSLRRSGLSSEGVREKARQWYEPLLAGCSFR